jgi:hypothetical protein
MLREKLKWKPHKSQSTDAENRDGITCSSNEASVMEGERRGYIIQLRLIEQPETGGLNEYSKVALYFKIGRMGSIRKSKSQ